MSTFKILNNTPLIRSFENFLSEYECNKIIEAAKTNLVPGQIIDRDGQMSIDQNYRDADTSYFDKIVSADLTNLVYDKVSDLINIDKSRFEDLTITHYSIGQHFKLHQDYFIEKEDPEYKSTTDERCSKGGNRISTVIIYLNSVEQGGETYFPWVDCIIKPEQGKLVQFDYNYSDEEYMSNVKSQHIAMPVIQGEKWIITVWVREAALTEKIVNYKKFSKESKIPTTINDVNYSLKCGDDVDHQMLDITLPGNNDPTNTIVVGFTGGMDSALVLYLVGALNNLQAIPYIIQPVCVISRGCVDPVKIFEDWPNVELMLDIIKNRVNGNIKSIEWVSAPSDSKRPLQVKDGLLKYFYRDSSELDYLRFRNNTYIFTGDNVFPKDQDIRWKSINYKRVQSKTNYWKQPLFNLEKHHIIDALMKLNLEEIIEKTSKGGCAYKHINLDEICEHFACNERRWGFTKLNNRYLEIGNKYFINKEMKND